MNRIRPRLPQLLAILVIALVGIVWATLEVSRCGGGGVMPTETPIETPSATATSTLTMTPTPEGTLAPTVTPTPTRPPQPITKIGPEISAGTHADLGKPRVVKLRNVSREYVGEVRQEVGPDALIVIRFEFDEPDKNAEPHQAARDWYARRRDDMLAMKASAAPNIAFETAVNECPEALLDWYVPFSLELISILHADGLRCVAGNPSVGTWSVEGWPKFKPVLEALNPDDFLGVHEYWADTADIQNPWHCGRWTIPEIAAVLGDVKIIVTECGRDVVEGRGQSGWRRTSNIEGFVYDLEDYDALLARSPNVVGATAYTFDRNWPDFDLFDVWPQVVFRYSLTPTPQP